MRSTVVFMVASALLLADKAALSQQSDIPDLSTQDTRKALQWTGVLDAYSSGNLNVPTPGGNALRAFDLHSETLRLNMVDLGLDYNTGHFGAHLDAGFGDAFRVMAASDRLHGANTYLSQYFFEYRPIKNSALQIDFGKFYTSVGAEVPDTGTDFNYSRSLLFTLGEPFYHFGLRVSVPISKIFTVGVQISNGWNNVQDNNSGKTFGFTTALTKTTWSWSQAVLVGPEKDGTTTGQRQLVNEVFTITPRSSMQSYIEALYGRDKRIGPGADAWYGAAIANRWHATKKLSLTPRLEYYIDQTGFTSGKAQHLQEVTATAEYKLGPLVTTRLEYREDLSNKKFFTQGGSGLVRQQPTIALAVLVSMKGER